MANNLFRQKSLERISSPEQLHDYMRVTSPRLWMLLGAVVALLTGFIIYASTATMENAIPIKVEVMNVVASVEDDSAENRTESLCVLRTRLSESYQQIVMPGMEMRLGNERGKVELLTMIDDEDGSRLNVIYEMENRNFYLPDGVYDGTLVLESTTPISFLWN